MKVDARLDYCLQKLTSDYNEELFVPILESDVVGYLYHLWISHLGEPEVVHLDTRLCASPKQKFDFVIGNVNLDMDRPCVEEPELVIEVKAFPIGMSGPQHRVHWKHVVEDDIPKLARLGNPRENRYQLLFDEADYLKGRYLAMKTSKIDYVKKVRDDEDANIVIIYIRKFKNLRLNLL